MLQASDIRLPVEVDLGSTYEEINALSEKFKELESKFEGKTSVEGYILINTSNNLQSCTRDSALCWSVGRSVGWSIGWFIRQTVMLCEITLKSF